MATQCNDFAASLSGRAGLSLTSTPLRQLRPPSRHSMKRNATLVRLVFGLVCVTGLAAVGLVGREVQPAADQMTEAADGLLDSLSPELRRKAEFEFDDPHRTAWFFTPQQDKDKNFTRKGVRLEELNDEQKKK